MKRAIPLTFQRNKPKDENDFNDKVDGILNSERPTLEREHPSVSFALARVIPDHSITENDLLIEAKYIRGSTTPSKASSGIAEDLTKYPESFYILFIVYDPLRAISDDQKFRSDIEGKGRCTAFVIR